MQFNLPNILTLIRILLIPVFVLFFYLPFHWGHLASAIVFALAAVTDYLDGIVARMLEQTTPLGEFLDPVADKLMVAVALILIVGEKSLYFITIPAAIIVGREIAISALREWMAELGKRASIAVSYVGKAKTLIQMLAVILLLIYKPGEHWSLLVSGYTLLYLAAILTLWSMMMYLKAAWPALTE